MRDSTFHRKIPVEHLVPRNPWSLWGISEPGENNWLFFLYHFLESLSLLVSLLLHPCILSSPSLWWLWVSSISSHSLTMTTSSHSGPTGSDGALRAPPWFWCPPTSSTNSSAPGAPFERWALNQPRAEWGTAGQGRGQPGGWGEQEKGHPNSFLLGWETDRKERGAMYVWLWLIHMVVWPNTTL